jgi:hypothetical protein
MQSPASQRAPDANGTHVDSALHALVATPAVGSMLLLFVVVGAAALAVGMLSGLATHQFNRRNAPRELS